MIDQPKTTIHGVQQALRESARGTQAIILFVADLGFALMMPLLRRNFGENFFSPFLILVMGIFAIAMCAVFKVSPVFISIYLGIIAIASLYHSIVIAKRNRRDEEWYSWYEGDFNIEPLAKNLPKGNDYWFREIVYEPALVLLVGFFIGKLLDPGLGSVFLFSAPWMMLRSQYARMQHRKSILAARDQKIIAEQKLAAISGAPVDETKGYVVKNINNMRPHDKEALAKQMLDEKDFASLSSTTKA